MPTVTRDDVLAYLKSLAGRHSVSGQYIGFGPSSAFADIQRQTGHYPGMAGGEYFPYGWTNLDANLGFNQVAIDHWNAGGLVTICAHMPNPSTGGAVYDASALDADAIVTAGTSSNANFVRMLRTMGDGLKQLEAAGVVVILRPFHEQNGSWFWWGTSHMNSSQFGAMWNYTRDYLLNTVGLKNLIWLWSVNAGITGNFPIDALGQAIGVNSFDMIGWDLYADDPSDAADYNAVSAYGKPVCLAEYGSGDPNQGNPNFDYGTLIARIKSDMPNVVLWQSWWYSWGMENAIGCKNALSDPWVLNRGDIAVQAGATPVIPPVVTPPVVAPPPTLPPSADNTVVKAGTSDTIIDSLGNAWTITPAALVAVNGVPDTKTGGVVQLAYVKSVVWQENTRGLWWSKSRPLSAWLPPAGTATGPLPITPVPPAPVPGPPPKPAPSPSLSATTKAALIAELDMIGVRLATLRADIARL